MDHSLDAPPTIESSLDCMMIDVVSDLYAAEIILGVLSQADTVEKIDRSPTSVESSY